jgi:hypothetical protein
VLPVLDLERPWPAPTSLDDLPFTGRVGDSLQHAVLSFDPPTAHGLDLGLGVVLSPPQGGELSVLDLGSGVLRQLPVTGTFAVFGWIFPSTARALRARIAVEGEGERVAPLPLGPVLKRIGYSPASHPLFVRVAFRDLAQDLDPHESNAVRLHLPGGGVLRVHADPSRGGVLLRSSRTRPEATLDLLLASAFPGIRWGWRDERADARATRPYVEHCVPTPPEAEVAGLRQMIDTLRGGLLRIMAVAEPARHAVVQDQLQVFGPRDLIGQLFSSSAFPQHREKDQ